MALTTESVRLQAPHMRQFFVSRALSKTCSVGVGRCAVGRRPVRVRALLSDFKRVTSALKVATSMFDKFDENGDEELSMKETLALLNSDEYKTELEEALGVDVPTRDADDVEKLFIEMDKDGSGALNKVEFTMLWLALACGRCQSDPKVVLCAVCKYLDQDGDGKVSASEIKRFLPLLGPVGLAFSAVPIPPWASIDYRKVFGLPDDT